MKTSKAIVYNPEWQPEGSRDRLRWIENASRGLRVLGPVHDLRSICRMDHTGWHLDPLGDGETVHGVVIQLPGRSGFARFVPAVSDPCNDDCYLVDFRDVYTAPGDDTDEAKRDAARAADGMAERYAETERDYQTVETAKFRIEEARELVALRRKATRELIASIRDARRLLPVDDSTPVCKALRGVIASHRETVHLAIKEIRRLTDNPYSWLEG